MLSSTLFIRKHKHRIFDFTREVESHRTVGSGRVGRWEEFIATREHREHREQSTPSEPRGLRIEKL